MSGFVRDPRLPALGWRGYGAEPPAGAQVADEAAREVQKLALGVPGPLDWGSDRTYPIEANFDLLNGIDGVTRALRDRVSALEHEVGEALRQAEAQSDDEQRRAEAFIESLEARRADLRTRLRQTPGGQDGPDGRSAGL